MKTFLKWICGIFVVLLMIVGGGMYALSTERVKQWLYAKGVELLQETLGTRVKVDKITVSFSKGGIALYGLEIDDRKDTTMLKVDTLEAMVDLTRIFERKVEIERVYLHGATGTFYKERKDSAANYQFALDIIKELSRKEKKDKDKEEKKNKTPLSLDLKLLSLQRTYVLWDVKSLPHKRNKFDNTKKLDGNHMHIKVDNVQIRGKLDGNLPQKLSITDLKAKEVLSNTTAGFEELTLKAKDDMSMEANIEKLHAYFLYWNFEVKEVGPIILPLTMKDGKKTFDLTKPIGLELNDIKGTLANTVASIPKLTGSLKIVEVKTDSGTIKKKPVIKIDKTPLTARVILKDLARYKARALRNFTTPLNLTVNAEGELDNLSLHNVRVTNDDKRLTLTAEGKMIDITKKQQFKFHFRNVKLSARNGIKEQLVNHFAKTVNLKMQRQMRMLGNIHYHGHLNIYRWRQDFHGTVLTKFGNLNLNFNLNGKTRYMDGIVNTKNFEVGKVMNIKQVGKVSFETKFHIDIAGKKAAKKLGRVKGKLPRGVFNGTITEAHLLNDNIIIHKATIGFKSDGFTATGNALWIKSLFNIGIDFLYHQTATEQYYTYRSFITRDDKREFREWTAADIEKAKIETERYEKKLAAKKAKKADKEARKAEKAKAKAEKQAAKEAAKAEKQAAKEAAKAEKKAAKEAAKAAEANDTTKKKKKKRFWII